MSSIFTGADFFANQRVAQPSPSSDTATYDPSTPEYIPAQPALVIDSFFPSFTFDISATNRNFQTNVIIKQSEARSGILYFMQEKIESEPPLPTRTPATGIRPTYGGQ